MSTTSQQDKMTAIYSLCGLDHSFFAYTHMIFGLREMRFVLEQSEPEVMAHSHWALGWIDGKIEFFEFLEKILRKPLPDAAKLEEISKCCSGNYGVLKQLDESKELLAFFIHETPNFLKIAPVEIWLGQAATVMEGLISILDDLVEPFGFNPLQYPYCGKYPRTWPHINQVTLGFVIAAKADESAQDFRHNTKQECE